MGRKRSQRGAHAATRAKKRSADSHESSGASGGEGGDGDELPLQKRLHEGTKETVAATHSPLVLLPARGESMAMDVDGLADTGRSPASAPPPPPGDAREQLRNAGPTT